MSEVTRILSRMEQGDAVAADQLLPLVYDELRQLAAQKMAQEKPGQTLQATALVHEAFLRLVGDQQFSNRRHFFAAAAQAMRRILVENARRKNSQKHGGDRAREHIDESQLITREPRDDLLELDEALTKLTAENRPAADVVQLRYFGGLTLPETAQALGISARTAGRLWAYARAWLRREVEGISGPGKNS